MLIAALIFFIFTALSFITLCLSFLPRQPKLNAIGNFIVGLFAMFVMTATVAGI